MKLCSLPPKLLMNKSPTSSTSLNSCLAKAKCFFLSVRRQVWENRLLLLLGSLLLTCAKLCYRPTARKSWPSSSHKLVWLGSRLSKTSQMDLSDSGYVQALWKERLCGLQRLLTGKEQKSFTLSRFSQKHRAAKELLSSNGLTELPISVSWLLS